jgi:hypothetical protein
MAALVTWSPLTGCKERHGGDEGHTHAHVHNHQASEPQPAATLAPAEGAQVKILMPTKGQIFAGDQIPLEFSLAKGARGHHVHAYVDGELMGMFESSRGTLTGIKPGKHNLELRVVTADHKTELDATDKVEFSVQQ